MPTHLSLVCLSLAFLALCCFLLGFRKLTRFLGLEETKDADAASMPVAPAMPPVSLEPISAPTPPATPFQNDARVIRGRASGRAARPRRLSVEELKRFFAQVPALYEAAMANGREEEVEWMRVSGLLDSPHVQASRLGVPYW